jgi:hypothetical protein
MRRLRALVGWEVSSSSSYRSWVALSLVLAAGCAGSPVVSTLPEFREAALTGKRVAIARLAVSDDFGDARTGIMMSARTRTLATRSACESLSQAWDAGRVVCLVPGKGEPTAELLELERLYAEGRPIPRSLFGTVLASTKSDFVLLFRPEGVDAAQTIAQWENQNPFFPNPGGPVHTTAGMDLPARQTFHTKNETELSYTVSATLIDLRTTKPLRSAVHSGSASRTVKRNVGYAELPSAVTLLAEIMSSLGEAVLDD